MSKKVMSIDDLYDFCLKNKFNNNWPASNSTQSQSRQSKIAFQLFAIAWIVC